MRVNVISGDDIDIFNIGIGSYLYSEIPLLRPPKIKTFYLLTSLFWKFKLFFSSFSTPSVPLIRGYLWDCPKVVFKTTFGQSQGWSQYRNFTVFISSSQREGKLLWNELCTWSFSQIDVKPPILWYFQYVCLSMLTY